MIRISPADDHGLALDVIQIDGGTQSRATLNQHVVDDYAEAIKAGATFPPIVVFYDGKKHWLADGFHRFHAYQKAGRSNVAADVRQGTRRDAILHSVGANETHGLRRTNEDKRRAVLTLLSDAEWAQWSAREIARACRVDHKTVDRIREEHLGKSPDSRTVQRGSTVYTQKVAKARATGAPAPQEGGDEKQEITAETVAPQGVEGGAEAVLAEKEIAPAAKPAIDRRDVLDPVRWQVIQLREVWAKASDEARGIFLAEITESNQATGTGGGDVDRSAKRASSAVEVGAPVSPERATKQRANVLSQHEVRPGSTSPGIEQQCDTLGVTAGETAAGETGMVLGTGKERPLSVGGDADGDPEARFESVSLHQSKSTAPTVEAVATPQAPQPIATAEVSNPQEPTSSPVTADSPTSNSSPASGTIFTALSKVDQIRLLRPHCQHPGTDLCGGSGREHCHGCKKLMAKSEAA